MQKFLNLLAICMLLAAFISLAAYFFMPGTKFDLSTPATYAILAIAVRLTKMDMYRPR